MENIKIHKIYVDENNSLDIQDDKKDLTIKFVTWTWNEKIQPRIEFAKESFDEIFLRLHKLNPDYIFYTKGTKYEENSVAITFEFMELPKINKEFMGVKLNIVEYKVLKELESFAMNNQIFTGVDVKEVMEKYLLRKGKLKK